MSIYLNDYNNQLEKDTLCFYGAISYLISGILYFYYLNSIKDCECVNKIYVYNVKKYFVLAAGMYLINCIQCTNKTISNLLSLLIIIFGFCFVYSVRVLINDIYIKNCECADTKITTVINILNYISIFMYVHYAIMIFLLLLLIITIPDTEEYKNVSLCEINEMDEMNEMDEIDEDMKENNRVFLKIVKTLKSKNMTGGNVESLAKSFYEKNMVNGLKKILNKIS